MRKIEQVYTLLNTPLRIIITMHQKPDGDALGSALGLYHFLRKSAHDVTVISPTNWAGFLNWMPGAGEALDYIAHNEKAKERIAAADIIFCLDFNRLDRLKTMAIPVEEAKAIKVLIDHHEMPDTAKFDYGICIPEKSSTAEMVFDFIHQSPQPFFDEDIASCLYAGIMTDTGSFRYASTRPETHSAVSRLMETGFDHSQVHASIFDTYAENRLRFTGFMLLNRMEVIYELNTVLLWASRQDLQKFHISTGDTEGIINIPFSIEGMRMVAMVTDREEERKWSFRSKGDIDVSEFATKFFSGGGHKNAAGGSSPLGVEDSIRFFKEHIQFLSPKLAEPYFQ